MPSAAVTLEAVYVDDNVTVEAKGTAMIESVTPNASTGKVSFVSVVNVPTNCTMVKGGLVATSNSTIGENVTADNAAFVKLSTKITSNTKSLKYTWTKSGVTASTTWYVRSYLVYRDADGEEHTVYSDAVKAVCILQRAKENHICTITKAEAYTMLLQQSYRPSDRMALAQTLALLDNMANNVTLWRLGCNMELSAAETAYHALKGN